MWASASAAALSTTGNSSTNATHRHGTFNPGEAREQLAQAGAAGGQADHDDARE